MEKRTIGRFIATLRKANGMTQKELAEKLNVSDKTVSRWERDESVPDLTLIPVIAEIFNVTTDELLRGEKKPLETVSESSEKMSNKSEKQLKHMVNDLKTKLQIRSIISIGIALIGFIVSVICNSVLYQSELAFLIGVIFIIIALICESSFYCLARSSIHECELKDDLLWDCKMTLFRTVERTISTIIIILAGMIPLLLFILDSDVIGLGTFGVPAQVWVKYGAIAVFVAGTVCVIVSYLINRRLFRENSKLFSDEELLLQETTHKRNKKTGLIIVVTLCITCSVQFVVNRVGAATWFTDGYTYDNYEDFVSFMETGDDDYKDGYKEELIAEDGTVLCSYIWNNSTVARIDFGELATGYLPIKVYTDEHAIFHNQCINRINNVFLILYIVEIVGIFVLFSNYKSKN